MTDFIALMRLSIQRALARPPLEANGVFEWSTNPFVSSDPERGEGLYRDMNGAKRAGWRD